MDINLWVSTDEVANWLIDNTIIKNMDHNIKKLVESDANNPNSFHRIPEAIKRILYLDAVDIIIEINKKPILAVEITHEAGTGHNAFQRFARIVAAAENDVPVAYIYPEASFIHRKNSDRWDRINPNIFRALECIMQIHNIPALLYYYPTEYNGNFDEFPSTAKGLIHDDNYLSSPNSQDSQINLFFDYVDLLINRFINKKNSPIINERIVSTQRLWMQNEFMIKGGNDKQWSPDTATLTIPTDALIKFLKKYSKRTHDFGELLNSRKFTVIYKVNAKLRGDPYPGALTAVDYLQTRIGKHIEDRDKNLVLVWGDVEYDDINQELTFIDSKTSVNDFMESVNKVTAPKKCLLQIDNYDDLDYKNNDYNVPRYYMQVNHSCTFTKKKELRVYSAFADAILFKDGALWREG